MGSPKVMLTLNKYTWEKSTVYLLKKINIKCYSLETTSACHTRASSGPPTGDHHCDLIGPPHPVSNLRPLHFYVPDNETPIETRFRLKRQEVQQWNQNFWTKQNNNFIEERKEFTAAHQREGGTAPNADEMSVFYKAFLDKYWSIHLQYNLEWYRHNAQLILLHLRVKMAKLLRSSSK